MNIQFDALKIKEIIQNLNLSDIVQAEGIQLQNAGANREKCPCPLHDEKTASFFIYNQKSFHCFGCGAGGDAINFIRKYHGLSFPDALKYAGIESGQIQYNNPAYHKKVMQEKKKQARVKYFHVWVNWYCSYLADIIRMSHEAKRKIKSMQHLDIAAGFLKNLSILEYWHELLIFGDTEDKFQLFLEWRNREGVRI